jgi:hypothetical protein
MALPNAAQTLPVMLTIGHAWRLLWTNRDDLLRLAIVPAGLSFALDLVALALEGGSAETSAAADPRAGFWLILVAKIVLATLFSVSWLRFLLLRGERNRRDFGMRWTRRHTTFLWRNLVLILCFTTIVVLVAALTGGALSMGRAAALEASGAGAFVVGLVLLAGTYICFRLSLIFPAIAVGQAYGFAQSWRDTAGVGLQLVLIFGLILASGLLPFVLLVEIGAATGFLAAAPFTATLVQTAFGFVLTAATLNVLAIAFGRLSGWRDPSAPGAGPA